MAHDHSRAGHAHGHTAGANARMLGEGAGNPLYWLDMARPVVLE